MLTRKLPGDNLYTTLFYSGLIGAADPINGTVNRNYFVFSPTGSITAAPIVMDLLNPADKIDLRPFGSAFLKLVKTTPGPITPVAGQVLAQQIPLTNDVLLTLPNGLQITVKNKLLFSPLTVGNVTVAALSATDFVQNVTN